MYIPEVQFDVNDEFFLSSSLEIHELGDEFVAAGSAGTAAAKRKNKNKNRAAPKMIDVNLTRVQFTGKLQSNYKFCKEALSQALILATQFRMNTSWLFKQYDDLVAEASRKWLSSA